MTDRDDGQTFGLKIMVDVLMRMDVVPVEYGFFPDIPLSNAVLSVYY